jgi:hypothetical protein
MYLCMNVCMNVCMDVCIYLLSQLGQRHRSMQVCMNVCIYLQTVSSLIVHIWWGNPIPPSGPRLMHGIEASIRSSVSISPSSSSRRHSCIPACMHPSLLCNPPSLSQTGRPAANADGNLDSCFHPSPLLAPVSFCHSPVHDDIFLFFARDKVAVRGVGIAQWAAEELSHGRRDH